MEEHWEHKISERIFGQSSPVYQPKIIQGLYRTVCFELFLHATRTEGTPLSAHIKHIIEALIWTEI